MKLNPSYTFDVIATDDGDGLLSATQEITINVNDLNDDPVITSDTGAPVDENNTEIYTATATDEDADDTVTLSLSGTDAGKMTIDASTGVVTLSSAADYETQPSYDFDIEANDGTTTVTENIVVNINDVNEAPEITTETTDSNYDENQDYATNPIFDANASDQDAGDSISFSLDTTKDHELLSINSVSGEVSLLANADYETGSSYSFDVIATDGLLSATQEITVNINDLNDDPVITSDTGTLATAVDEGNTEIYTATATDEDAGDTVTLSLSGTDADKMTLDASTGVVTLVVLLIMRHSLVMILF